MITTAEIIGFFIILTIIVWLSIWYYTSASNSKSNFEIIHTYKDYLKSFNENYLHETSLKNITKEGTIVLCDDVKELKSNFHKLDDRNLYKCFTSEGVKMSHPKLEKIPKSYPNKHTFDKLLYNSMRNNCVIINFFTKGLIEEWKNLLYTLRKVNLSDLLVVFPLDNEALNAVKSENIKYDDSLINDNLAAETTFAAANFKNITCNKVLAISKILKQGKFVFYLDTDIVINKNIVEDYFTFPPMDIYMQSDQKHFNKTGSNKGKWNYCSGVMFIAPTTYMINIMDSAYPKILQCKPGDLTDQKVLNNMINPKKIGCLCPYKYPNGYRYFMSKTKCRNPYLIHNNWIRGLDNKIKRFKEYNLWYI